MLPIAIVPAARAQRQLREAVEKAAPVQPQPLTPGERREGLIQRDGSRQRAHEARELGDGGHAATPELPPDAEATVGLPTLSEGGLEQPRSLVSCLPGKGRRIGAWRRRRPIGGAQQQEGKARPSAEVAALVAAAATAHAHGLLSEWQRALAGGGTAASCPAHLVGARVVLRRGASAGSGGSGDLGPGNALEAFKGVGQGKAERGARAARQEAQDD